MTSPSRRTILLISGFITFALAIAAFARLLSGGVQITVKNESGASVRNIQVSYTGGVYNRASLASGSEFSRPARPTSESHVEVTYVPADGTPRRHVVDCYFEGGYRGSVAIAIAPSGSASSEANIKLPWPVGGL